MTALAVLTLGSLSVATAAVNEPASTAKKGAQAPSYNLSQVAFINDQIRQGWEGNSLTPSVLATDSEWCRRLFLDVLGRTPSVDELLAFINSSEPDKKAKLVGKLLGDEYIEEYASNWTTIWTNILIGRSGGNDRRSPINRLGMQQSSVVRFNATRRTTNLCMTSSRLVV